MNIFVYLPMSEEYLLEQKMNGKNIKKEKLIYFKKVEKNSYYNECKDFIMEMIKKNEYYTREKRSFIHFTEDGDLIINFKFFGKNPRLNKLHYYDRNVWLMDVNRNKYTYDSLTFSNEKFSLERILSMIVEIEKNNILEIERISKIFETKIEKKTNRVSFIFNFVFATIYVYCLNFMFKLSDLISDKIIFTIMLSVVFVISYILFRIIFEVKEIDIIKEIEIEIEKEKHI